MEGGVDMVDVGVAVGESQQPQKIPGSSQEEVVGVGFEVLEGLVGISVRVGP